MVLLLQAEIGSILEIATIHAEQDKIVYKLAEIVLAIKTLTLEKLKFLNMCQTY
jgi:hypothetical protein